ncbi:MAG: DUF1638 domain-containing protein [Anaerolineales bacterium]
MPGSAPTPKPVRADVGHAGAAGADREVILTVGLIICGALGREVTEIVRNNGWDAEVIGVPAIDHVFPERIAPDVEQRILALREQYEKLIVVFGDCGSAGALDRMLQKYPDIERLQGPHCYEFYGGDAFHQWMEDEPGTFFLTDFMVRTFNGLIMKSMGLDRFPTLKKEYFRNYRKVLYLAQSEHQELVEKAHDIAEYLELPLEVKQTGYGGLEERIAALLV